MNHRLKDKKITDRCISNISDILTDLAPTETDALKLQTYLVKLQKVWKGNDVEHLQSMVALLYDGVTWGNWVWDRLDIDVIKPLSK